MLQGGDTFSRCNAQIALVRFSSIAKFSNENKGGLGRCLCFWDGAEPSASERGGGDGRRRGLNEAKRDDELRRDMEEARPANEGIEGSWVDCLV